MEGDSADSSVSLNIESTSAREFNVYGSPVVRREATGDEAMREEESSQGLVICSCKNTCSRGRTANREGCPCKNAGKNCTEQCSCGTKNKRCKNVEQANSSLVLADPSAFERNRKALEAARIEIENFVEALTREQMSSVMVRLLTQGKGSLNFAQNLLRDLENPEPEQPTQPARLPWCICCVCRVMPSEEENKCCKKVRCVTSYTAFQHNCIDQGTLKLLILSRCDIRADVPDFSSNSYRKAAYRSYILWKYGKLGKKNRRVVPACVVAAIRRAYPSPDNVYMGFRAS